MPGVDRAVAEIKHVAVPPIPLVVIVAVETFLGIEAACFLLERSATVGSGEPAVGAGGSQAVILGNVARLAFAAGGLAGPFLADVLHAGNRLAIAKGIEGGHRVVVHVPTAVVLHLRHGVVHDIPILYVQAHIVPRRAVRPGNRAAHHVAIVVELADRIAAGQSMQHHRHGLPPGKMVPVPHGPALLLRAGPFGRDTVNHACHVGVVGGGVGHHLEVADFGCRHSARKQDGKSSAVSGSPVEYGGCHDRNLRPRFPCSR